MSRDDREGGGGARHLEVACTLGHDAAARQVDEWRAMRGVATSAVRIPGGARLVVPVEHRRRLDDLVARESACCAFLSFATAATHVEVEIEITATSAEGAAVAELLAGVGD